MRVNLLFKDRNIDLNDELIWNHEALVKDLELTTLFNSMANGDDGIFDVVRHVVLSAVKTDAESVIFRQNILQDCLKNKSVVTEIHSIAIQTVEKEKRNFWGIFSKHPDSILYRSVDVLEMYVQMLRRLRTIADERFSDFGSEGFQILFRKLQSELNDDYFETLQEHLRELKFRSGLIIRARLGKGNKGTDYVLGKFRVQKLRGWKRFISKYILPFRDDDSWFRRIADKEDSAYTFYINSRDESEIRSLHELRDVAINSVANSLAQSNDHILSFFHNLKTELSFYVGCINLSEQLNHIGVPCVMPVVGCQNGHSLFSTGLYDISLALTMKKQIVGNCINSDQKKMVLITGANQGGKSTFLRSIGQAQLMMECGMFVPAITHKACLSESLITHFHREEDAGMKSGRLDEELYRMDKIVDRIKPGAMILFNESFSATNEREGSEIACQIVEALLEHNINVFFVTHLYQFASVMYDKYRADALYLRADRQPDGVRTFKLVEGKPLQTGFGEDLYNEIFREESRVHYSYEDV